MAKKKKVVKTFDLQKSVSKAIAAHRSDKYLIEELTDSIMDEEYTVIYNLIKAEVTKQLAQ